MEYKPEYSYCVCGECEKVTALCFIDAKTNTVEKWICPNCKHEFYPEDVKITKPGEGNE
jgi:hypothetical protein